MVWKSVSAWPNWNGQIKSANQCLLSIVFDRRFFYWSLLRVCKWAELFVGPVYNRSTKRWHNVGLHTYQSAQPRMLCFRTRRGHMFSGRLLLMFVMSIDANVERRSSCLRFKYTVKWRFSYFEFQYFPLPCWGGTYIIVSFYPSSLSQLWITRSVGPPTADATQGVGCTARSLNCL